MLKTPIGILDINIDGKGHYYKLIKLDNTKKNFSVDSRYRVIVDIPLNKERDVFVECKLLDFIGDNAKGCIESGERLALISFYYNNIKLSIGIEDEISNVKCNYIDYGLQVVISKKAGLQQIIFGIAWVFMKDKEIEDIYTWFAADPTI